MLDNTRHDLHISTLQGFLFCRSDAVCPIFFNAANLLTKPLPNEMAKMLAIVSIKVHIT